MYVEVNDQNAGDAAVIQCVVRCEHDVIEHAKTFSTIVKSMVRTARYI